MTITPRDEFLTDVLITAVEGGIGHWADDITDYCYDDDAGRRGATISCYDDASIEGFRLTLGLIENGIKLIADPALQIASDYRREIAQASTDNDAGDIDAGLADCIVQAAVFGSIAYC